MKWTQKALKSIKTLKIIKNIKKSTKKTLKRIKKHYYNIKFFKLLRKAQKSLSLNLKFRARFDEKVIQNPG